VNQRHDATVFIFTVVVKAAQQAQLQGDDSHEFTQTIAKHIEHGSATTSLLFHDQHQIQLWQQQLNWDIHVTQQSQRIT